MSKTKCLPSQKRGTLAHPTASLSFFMSIGSVIRSDASPIVQQAYWNSRRSPIIMAAAHRAPFPARKQ